MWEIFCPRKEKEKKGRKRKRFGLESPLYCLYWEKKDRSWRVFMGVREKGRNRRSQLDGRRKKRKKDNEKEISPPSCDDDAATCAKGWNIFFLLKKIHRRHPVWETGVGCVTWVAPCRKMMLPSNREKLVFISRRGEKKKRENWRNNHGKRELSSLQGRPRSTSYPLSDDVGGVTRPKILRIIWNIPPLSFFREAGVCVQNCRML